MEEYIEDILNNKYVRLEKIETKDDLYLIDSILPPNKYVMLKVSDTGVGIKEKNLNKIFEPYFSTKNKKEGTGLGLFVVHGIINKNNVYIDVKSEFNKGTDFFLYFPISNNSFDEVVITKREYLSSSSLYGKRILFVDDEEMIIKSMSKLLTKKGFIVDSFVDSIKAYDKFKEYPNNYDIIITDQSMPGITGIELTSKIKKINKDIPVILCSGYNNMINETNMSNYKVDEYLEKPLAINQLITSITHLLSTKNS